MTRVTPPFRFGVQVRAELDGAELAAIARRAEALGYDVLTVPDHFPAGLAPFAALATAAAATERLRVGTFVTAVGFRHPAVLAREAATLDRLSGGRFELGVGAGWLRSEYEQVGLPWEPAGIRIERLEEAVTLLRRLLGPEGDDPVSLDGRFYQVRDLALRPRPAQPGGPPILIGGGSRRVLSLAGRTADIVGFGPKSRPDGTLDPASTSVAATAEKAAWIDAAVADRDPQPERNIYVYGVTETDDPEAAAASLSAQTVIPTDDLLNSPHFLFGSVAKMAADLEATRERFGCSYITVGDHLIEPFAPVLARVVRR